MVIQFDNQEKIKTIDDEKLKKIKSPKRQKFSRFVLFLMILSTFVMLSYALLLPAGPIFGIAVGAFWFCIIIVSTICTAGIIWLSEGFKTFSTGCLDLIGKLMTGSAKVFSVIKPFFPIIAIITGFLVVLGLVLNIIWFKKPKENETHNKRRMIIAIVLSCIYFINLIIAIVITAVN